MSSKHSQLEELLKRLKLPRFGDDRSINRKRRHVKINVTKTSILITYSTEYPTERTKNGHHSLMEKVIE